MKALIIGSDPTGHEVDVQTAFEAGGGVDSDIYKSELNQTLIDYAKANNYDAIIYSYAGEESYFALANSNPDVMIFMPSDSYNGDLQQLVLTDLLPSSDDAEFYDNTQSSQSESNGYICGQLFYIAGQVGCSLQEARIRANATKDENGIIDVDLAIAYEGTIQLTVGNITAERTDTLIVSLVLERIVDATNYRIKVTLLNGDLVEYIETTSLTYEYTLPDYDVYLFSYMGYTTDLESSYSDAVQEGQISFQFFLIQEEDMAFGLAVSDYNLITGSYGNMIRADISTYLPKSISFIQGETSGGVKTDTFENNVSLNTLQDYLEDENCPDLAWNFSAEILTIFIKTYSGDDEITRFSFAGTRKAQKLSADADLIDAPNEMLGLIGLYAKNKAWFLKKKKYDPDLIEQQDELEHELRVA